mgnify:CR=1 FL=1
MSLWSWLTCSFVAVLGAIILIAVFVATAIIAHHSICSWGPHTCAG